MAEVLQSKYDALNIPKTPKVLEVDNSIQHINHAREQLATARDKFRWQCVRENMLEALAYAPPIQAPSGGFDSSAKKIQLAGTRLLERREFLNSMLRSLEATKTEAMEAKARSENKFKLVKENDEGRKARNEALAYTSASSLKMATDELKTETNRNKEEITRLIQAKTQMKAKLEAVNKSKDRDMMQLQTLENEVGSDTTRLTITNTNNTTAPQKRSAEMAELVTIDQEAKNTTGWFQSMSLLCDKLSGVKVIGFQEEMQAKNEETKEKFLHVEFSFWDKHQFVITLGKGENGMMDDKDILIDAELTTNFDTKTLKEVQLLNDQNLNQYSHEEVWKKTIISGYLKTDGVLSISDLVLLAKQLPPPTDVQWLIRECLARIAVWPERCAHLYQLRQVRKFVVNSTERGCLVSLPAGVVVALRLSPDYPRSTGAVVVESLTGVGSWRDEELKVLRDELNKTQWDTMDSLFDVLEARLSQMSNK